MAALDDVLTRMEELLHEVEGLGEPTRGRVLELLDGIDTVHRIALGRLPAVLGEEGVERLRDADPALAWLLEAYAVGVDERAAAERALEEVRPFVQSHGGAIELLDVRGGVVAVRLSRVMCGLHGVGHHPARGGRACAARQAARLRRARGPGGRGRRPPTARTQPPADRRPTRLTQAMEAGRDAIAQLEERLRRHPADRYPVQHATARFHLGATLAQAGDLAGAEEALATAAHLFASVRLGAEHGKAMNALGAVLRQAGRPREAAEVLARAAADLQSAGLVAEHGAARFNLGLVRREAGDLPAAVNAFERARALLEEARAPSQAAAAARELGAARLSAGDLEAARETLEHAAGLAQRAGDEAGAGAAANILGLVHLAADRAPEAVESFVAALAAHPRGVRPAEYTMAKANLALARERTGDAVRARLSARQALGVPSAPGPVRAQAQAVLDRLGAGPGDVLALLDVEDRERWPALVREEIVRWVDADAAERREELGAWIDGQVARDAVATDLAEAFVASLLELPPEAMEAVMRSAVEALGERHTVVQRGFRSQVARATARFHVPQLLRVRDTFNRLAVELDEEPGWS